MENLNGKLLGFEDNFFCIDLSNLKNLKQGNLENKNIRTSLCMKYKMEKKRIVESIEHLKQSTVAISEDQRI